MPYLKRPNRKAIYYTYKVEVPYDKDPSGSVTLYLKVIPEEKPSPHYPGTPEHIEVIEWDGVLYDDDLPNLEDEAISILIDQGERI